MGYGQSDARGYTGARNEHAVRVWKELVRELGKVDRDPFDTLREDPFEDDGEAWDVERDSGLIRYASGERFMERETR